MNQRILIVISLLLAFNYGFGQRFEGGLLVGLNASQVKNAQLPSGILVKGYQPGIMAGVYVQTEIAPAVFGAMEIKYAQMGARHRQDPKSTSIPEVYTLRLGYVDIPVYAGFRTSDRGSIIGGINFGYLAHSKEKNEYGELPPEDQRAFNKFDVRPFIGFKFDFLDNVDADLRFAHSILPIRSHPGDAHDEIYWYNNQFNRVISLSLYYRLGR